MKAALFAVLALVTILATAQPAAARKAWPAGADSAATAPGAPAARPAAAPAVPCPPPMPLMLDSNDLGLGASVLFSRIPNAADLNDLLYIPNVAHVVLSLPEWPAGWEQLQTLQQSPLPEGADLYVVLPGYPPSRAAGEAWNFLRKPVRIVMVVDGPPQDRGMILELNAIRPLERVIADMSDPSRSGFERLQRPLSFRVIRR